jgi:hypothetical protein
MSDVSEQFQSLEQGGSGDSPRKFRASKSLPKHSLHEYRDDAQTYAGGVHALGRSESVKPSTPGPMATDDATHLADVVQAMSLDAVDADMLAEEAQELIRAGHQIV